MPSKTYSDPDFATPSYSPRKGAWLIIAIAALVLGWITIFKTVEEVDAGEVMIVQSLFDGELEIHTTPGPKWVGLGKITKYAMRDKVWFIDSSETHAAPKDAHGQPAFPIMFNDGGGARVNGSIDYELPLDTTNLLALHARYRSQDALENSGIRPAIAKSVYVSGPLMSATESYAARKNDLLASITDQTLNGIYRTKSSEVRVRDDVTGTDKTVLKAEIIRATNGVALREDTSILSTLGIKAYNLSIVDLDYSDQVQRQIAKQQESAAAAAQSVIEARTAEQRRLTAVAEAAAVEAKLKGEAEAKKAEAIVKAEQDAEVQKIEALKRSTNAVIEAQQKLKVAELSAQEAAEFAKAERLKGEGEAARRAAVLQADGALEKKLSAYVDVQTAYANALKDFKGAIVPQVVMDGSKDGSGSGDGFNRMLSLISVKAAKDLALDLSLPTPVTNQPPAVKTANSTNVVSR